MERETLCFNVLCSFHVSPRIKFYRLTFPLAESAPQSVLFIWKEAWSSNNSWLTVLFQITSSLRKYRIQDKTLFYLCSPTCYFPEYTSFSHLFLPFYSLGLHCLWTRLEAWGQLGGKLSLDREGGGLDAKIM